MNPLVIIPTFNERDHVLPLIQAISSLEDSFAILFVDDNSPDGTADLIHEYAASRGSTRKVHLLSRPRKQGLGSAYRDGFRWALARAFDPIFQMDADFSHDPAVLPNMLRSLETVDIVLGSRYIPGGRTIGWPMHRLCLSRFANLYAKRLTGSRVSDLTGGFKGFRKAALEKIVQGRIGAEGYAFQIQTTVFAERQGCRIAEIPITFKDREKGKSKLSRRVVWEAFFEVLRLARF